MFLASLRASGTTFFYSTRFGSTELSRTLGAPSGLTQFLVSVANRPYGEHFGKGDQVQLRSVANFNLLACRVDRVILVASALSLRADEAKTLFLASRRLLTTDFTIPIAIDEHEQRMVVEQAEFLTAPGGTLAHQRIRLAIDLPIVTVSLAAPPPAPAGTAARSATEGIAYSVPEATLSAIGLAVTREAFSSGVSPASTAPPPPIWRPQIVRCFVARGTDGAMELVASPHGDARDWFEVTLDPIVARFRDAASGRYLAMAADHRSVAMEASTPTNNWRFDFILNKISSPSSRLLAHGDAFWVRASRALLKSANVGVERAPVEVTAVGSEGEALYFTVSRAAGQGPVADGERVVLVAGRELSNPQRLTATPSGSLEVAPGTGTPFILELTKSLHWVRDAAGLHTSTPVTPAAGTADLGVVGRVFIGCPMHGSPLAVWRRGATAARHVSGLEQQMSATRSILIPAITSPFVFEAIQGYVLDEPAIGTVPVKAYTRSEPHVFLALRADQERAAAADGYTFGWIEGHAFAAGTEAPRAARTMAGATLADPSRASTAIAPAVDLGRAAGRPVVAGLATPRRVRALVLSGGGAKGCFEAGAVQALYRNWRPDIICGVSVGSVNAVKLAEGGSAADQLVTMWHDFGSTPNAIFLRDYYLNILDLQVTRIADRLGKIADAALFTAAASLGLGAPFFLGGLAVTAEALIAKDLSGIDPATVRVVNYTLNLIHGLHSMEPLRRLLRGHINFEAVARSGIQLRLGMTDMGTGQYFSATQPEPDLGTDLLRYGRLEREPDHQLGGSWLSHPIYGSDDYLMPLDEAVYCSSTLPVYMDPLRFDLGTTRRVVRNGVTYELLEGTLPPGLRELLAVTDPAAHGRPGYRPETWPAVNTVDGRLWEDSIDLILRAHFRSTSPAVHRADARARRDGDRGPFNRARGIFDGGLRDTLPIRTALRLGATEIISISGDRLSQTANGGGTTRTLNPEYANGVFSLIGGKFFNGIDLGSVPALRNFLGMLNLFISEVARSDSLIAWGQAEFGNWLERAAGQLTAAQRQELREQFDRYWTGRAGDAVQALGATTWTGGTLQRIRTPWGTPCSITHIVPPRDFIDALAFDDGTSIDDGLRLGADAAKTAWRYVRAES